MCIIAEMYGKQKISYDTLCPGLFHGYTNKNII